MVGDGLTRLAIIPARGGSKRLPRKNVVDFLGKPMLAYSIEAARDSGRFERILVSTEDDEIARVATQWGAEVHRRDPMLATDTATVEAVCLGLLAEEEQAGRHWDVFACLYAAAPLRTAEDVQAVVDLVEPGRWDFAMAVSEYDLPPLLALRPTPEGGLEPLWPELIHGGMRRIKGLTVSNGSSYAAAVPAFRRVGTFYGPTLRGHLTPPERCADINVPADLEAALWKARNARP